MTATPTDHILCLSQLVDGFILNSQLEGKSDHTIEGYRSKLARFIDFTEDNPISEITTTDIRQYLNYVKQSYNLSLATVE